jgi:phosphatidylethanolamine/phosphatidyl-N-methylethanolamine N-methyltransferase
MTRISTNALMDWAQNKPSVKRNLEFFKLWLRNPGDMGAVVPSGRALARAMAEQIDASDSRAVVELGGGTGSITRALQEIGIAPEKLVVVEREKSLCRILRKRFPEVTVLEGDAQDLRHLLDQAGVGPIHSIVSGLPLLLISPDERREIFDQAFSCLPEDGSFLQFTYGRGAPLPPNIRENLSLEATRLERIYSNLPPAALWRFRRTAEILAAAQ